MKLLEAYQKTVRKQLCWSWWWHSSCLRKCYSRKRAPLDSISIMMLVPKVVEQQGARSKASSWMASKALPQLFPWGLGGLHMLSKHSIMGALSPASWYLNSHRDNGLFYSMSTRSIIISITLSSYCKENLHPYSSWSLFLASGSTVPSSDHLWPVNVLGLSLFHPEIEFMLIPDYTKCM